MKQYGFLAFIYLSATISVASAQTCGEGCIQQPSCASLGYRQSITCADGYITCPFDSSYKWCKEYKCEDGRYYSSPLSASGGYSCTEVEYHGLTCYDCDVSTCPVGYYDTATCWAGQMYQILNDMSLCKTLGYTDVQGDCDEYLACPSDSTQIKCIVK